jgi:hypothetical protein
MPQSQYIANISNELPAVKFYLFRSGYPGSCERCIQDEGSESDVKVDGEVIKKGEQIRLKVGSKISFGSSDAVYKVSLDSPLPLVCPSSLKHLCLQVQQPLLCTKRW